MDIQTPTPPNQIRTLALVPGPLQKQLVKWEAPIEARPIPRSECPADLEPNQPTDAQVAQWNAFLEYEIDWRVRLLDIAASRRRTLTPHERRELREQLYKVDRGLRSDVGFPWNQSYDPLPPDLSRALWHKIFAVRGQERINGRVVAAHLAAVKLDTDPSLTFQQRIALLKRCGRALDEKAPRMGRTLPKTWKPKPRPADVLRAFRQAAVGAMFPNSGSM